MCTARSHSLDFASAGAGMDLFTVAELLIHGATGAVVYDRNAVTEVCPASNFAALVVAALRLRLPQSTRALERLAAGVPWGADPRGFAITR
jgi:hypothetical protein